MRANMGLQHYIISQTIGTGRLTNLLVTEGHRHVILGVASGVCGSQACTKGLGAQPRGQVKGEAELRWAE